VGPPLHADLRFLAQCGRDVLLEPHPPAPQARRLPWIVELQAAINRYLAEHNQAPTPFTWTKIADHIFNRLNHPNASLH
jgi:hypothetical protein